MKSPIIEGNLETALVILLTTSLAHFSPIPDVSLSSAIINFAPVIERNLVHADTQKFAENTTATGIPVASYIEAPVAYPSHKIIVSKPGNSYASQPIRKTLPLTSPPPANFLLPSGIMY